jgi:hypothetical protein
MGGANFNAEDYASKQKQAPVIVKKTGFFAKLKNLFKKGK